MALPDGLPEHTLGWGILNWCSKWLVNPDSRGGVKGERWVFRPDQARFILWLYAVDENGEWTYRRAYRERAKGSGKSPMVAAIACAEFLGPSKFSHFDANGMAIGTENPDAIIWLAAISIDGCRHTYRYIMSMLQGVAEHEFDLDIGMTRILVRGKADNKIIEQVTANFRTREGPQPTFVIAEETQNWVPAERGPDLFEVLSRGLTKTDGRLVEVTNAPVPGEGSVAEETKRTWSEIESGDRDDGEGLLYDTFGIHVKDIYDYDQAMPALEIIYEHAPWMKLSRVFRDIKDRQVREINARRFFFNETIAPNAMWLSEQIWESAKRKLVLSKQDKIALGFRVKKDCAAVVCCRLEDKAIFLMEIWEKPQGADRFWEVPYAKIDTKVRSILEKHAVVHMVASPENFQDIVGRWAIDYESSVLIEELWLSRNKQKHADAVEQFESAISDERVIHSGDTTLRRHIMNCFKEEVPQGFLLRQETPYSHRYIVAAEAAVLAMEAAQAAIEDGGLSESSGGFYIW